MAKIYEFPTEKHLPQELKDRLQAIAENYLYVLEEAVKYFYGDTCTDEQIDEVGMLVTTSYLDVISDVIDKYEGS
jgi:hypothetical protein